MTEMIPYGLFSGLVLIWILLLYAEYYETIFWQGSSLHWLFVIVVAFD